MKEDKMKGEKTFYCGDCLRLNNIGKYFVNKGDCGKCGKKDVTGDWVTINDINMRDLTGKDCNGLDWSWTFPGFNSAEAESMCPVCGHNVLDRKNFGQFDPATMSKYNCNDCGCALRVHNDETGQGWKFVQTTDQLKLWLEVNRIIIVPGGKYASERYGDLQFFIGRKTVFFIDKDCRVAGNMLIRPAGKSRTDIGVSQAAINRMLNCDEDSQCQWESKM